MEKEKVKKETERPTESTTFHQLFSNQKKEAVGADKSCVWILMAFLFFTPSFSPLSCVFSVIGVHLHHPSNLGTPLMTEMIHRIRQGKEKGGRRQGKTKEKQGEGYAALSLVFPFVFLSFSSNPSTANTRNRVAFCGLC